MMAEHQRVHPADVEASAEPTVPLVPSGAPRSEFAGRATPARDYQQPRRKKNNSCCRCLCCALCFFIAIIATLAVLAIVFYFVFQPRLPKYSLTKLSVKQFGIIGGSTLSATLDAEVVARNPNKKIGIYYEGGSHIGVWYETTKLCEGSFPEFYQGHKNTTVLDVLLSGQTDAAVDLLNKIHDIQNSGDGIILMVRVKQPVRIKVGRLKLMKMKFRVKCNLSIKNLAAGNTISFGGTNCKIRFLFF